MVSSKDVIKKNLIILYKNKSELQIQKLIKVQG